MIKPKISVIMPVYNGEQFLAEAIESILNQTFSDFEFLIMDDGSTDRTHEILRFFAAKDKRLKIFHQKNQGIVKSLNYLIDQAKGDIVARMDADDIAMSTRFEKQYQYLEKHPGTVLLGSFCELIKNGEIIGINTAFIEDFMNRWFLSLHPPFIHSSVLIRKYALTKIGKYREDSYPAEDYDLWVRIKRLGKIENLAEILTQYRINENGISAKKWKQQLKVRDEISLKNLADIYEHDEIPALSKIIASISRYELSYYKQYVIGKICCLTGCYLVQKGETTKAIEFFKQAIKMDKKRFLDALPNLFLAKFGRAYLISIDYSPFAHKITGKIHWFLDKDSKKSHIGSTTNQHL